MQTSQEVLSCLRRVRTLHFNAQSQAGTGWEGVGKGKVKVSAAQENSLVFHESGNWQPNHKSAEHPSAFAFTNTFRWTAIGHQLRLEHLRFGVDKPVLLFDMAPDEAGQWREVDPHLCGQDVYAASLTIEGNQIRVAWSIKGPRKQESIVYSYQTDPTA
ncbi:MAG: DUF6314 family protein [Pseudomonadota bacterium]|jgi:hypothetical protein